MNKTKLIVASLILFNSISCARLNIGRNSAAPEVVVIVHDENEEEGAEVSNEYNNDQLTDQRVTIKSDREHSADSDLSWNTIVDRAEERDSVVSKLDFEVVNYGEFTKSEVAHISKCDYDPFNGQNELYIDIDYLKNNYCYPVKGEFLSDYGIRNGRMHTGLDIRAELGEKVYALFSGIVRFSKYYYGYGNVVVIRHANGLESVYGHNSKNLVKSGDVVNAGDPIALGGRTGSASCTHVHFEIRVKGKTIDPKFIIDPKKMVLQSKNFYIYNNGSSILATYSRKGATNKESSPLNLASASDKNSSSISKNSKDSDTSKATDAKSEKKTVKSKIHTIKKGDTLYRIAKANSTSVSNLCRINGITEKTVLRIGQKLKVS